MDDSMLNQSNYPSKSSKTSQLPGDQYLSRQSLLEILDAALGAKEYHFAYQLAQKWLTLYPGDLQASLAFGRALLGGGRFTESLTVLRGLSQADPENRDIIDALLAAESATILNSPALTHTPANQTDVPIRSDVLIRIDNWLVALTGKSTSQPVAKMNGEPKPEWGERLYAIRKDIQAGNLESAEEAIPGLLGANINSPLVAVTHLRLLQADPETPLLARRTLAEFYHQQWPDCLPISLMLAEWLGREGETDRAVSLLHQAVARDIGGTVPINLWGENHPYKSLWPEKPGMILEMVLPASVTARLGWNQLQPGDSSSADETIPAPTSPPCGDPTVSASSTCVNPHATPDEQIIHMKSELDHLALGLNQLPVSAIDGRFPVYVIFSSYNNLVRQYGEQSTLELIQEMKNLAFALNNKSSNKSPARERWGAAVFLPDMAESTASLGISAPQVLDPWNLKLALIDLDAALAKRGEMIGALLIVGGPEIIPFHNLPNPVDDPDQEIPSDNPYATRDENYFIPEWPVGRLPGDSTNDPWLILQGLRRIRQAHANPTKMPSATRYLFTRLTSWLRPAGPRRGFGYTAAIWRPASMHVFKPVGESRAVLVSPPVGLNGKDSSLSASNGKPLVPLPNAYLGYFNLHGLPDAAEWYGQKDPLQTTDRQGRPLPDYPIALRPVDVQTLGEKTPRIVFSEACYGAMINNKNVEQALALKFLAHGTLAFAGSTSMAYGSVNAPLIAADLLGYTFWQGLMQGYSAGQAFQRAKIHLVNEMHQRQGYLDGEDQKSLISFVLYGDPLARLSNQIRQSKSFPRSSKKPLLVKTVCDRATGECHEEIDLAQSDVLTRPDGRIRPDQTARSLPPEVIGHVKQIVTRYLPGMEDAHLTYTAERSLCQSSDVLIRSDHDCPTSQSNGKNHLKNQPVRNPMHSSTLIVLRKEIKINRENGEQLHRRYARLTLDPEGRLVKMAVSR